MLAAVITSFGPPEVLQIREVPRPAPAPDQVLVRVRASALNRADLLQRVGRYPAPPDVPPDIPGIEFAGEIAGVGERASRWRDGDRVLGLIGGGAHAEYVVAHESTVAPLPPAIEWDAAGAIPEAFITASDALVSQARIAPGERVLIHAVASGVGLAAVQISRAWGAVPFGTTRTADKLMAARAVGLEDGITLADDLAPLGRAVARWSGGEGMHVVLDLVGGRYVAANIDAAAPRARLMLVGAIAGSEATIDVRRVLGKRLTIQGTVLRSRPLAEKIDVTAAFERDVVPKIAGGALRASIDSVYPLAEIADAHRRMESNETVGKVVLRMA